MKRVHPNLSLAAACAAIAMSLAAGCRNQQTGGIANPFLAPNRVTPPATRSLMPGQAQPYYPGDPIPVMQSGVVQPANGVELAAAPVPEMPSATENLAWTSPRGTAPATASAMSIPPTAAPQMSPPAPSMIASNEPTVAIPDDGNALRFALPAPAPQEPQPFIPNGPVALAATQPPVQPQQPMQLGARPTPQDLQQAAYTEPVMTNTQTAPTNPWRAPQIAPPTPDPPNYAYPQSIAAQAFGQPLAMATSPALPMSAAPTVGMTNDVEVRMREVPSPSMPRIRIPGYDTSTPMISSADGFRPRTSMR
jgi:hypothetical protein